MTSPDRRRTPAPLVVAAVLVAVEGVGLLALAGVGLTDVVPSRVEVGVSVAVFFAAYGGALLACARGLLMLKGWARGPVLLTQLIMLGIAWNVRENLLLAIPLAVGAVVGLVAMVQTSSIEALESDAA